MTTITGECFCGTIQFEINAPLAPGQSCHCSRCRKAFSGAGSAMAGVPEGAWRWTAGEENLTLYVGKHGWGIGFCKTCGSTICGVFEGEVKGVQLGMLDGEPEAVIARHIFVGSKAAWDEIGGDAPQHDAWPE